MNFYVRYFDDEALYSSMEDVIDFLDNIDEINMSPELVQELRQYAASDILFPKRCKVRSRVYFIIIKTEAATMQDFKDKKALRPAGAQKNENDELTIEREGWYEGSLAFKRVIVNRSGKCEYRDTDFTVRCKASSPKNCYDRIVDHLRTRVDARSQFPSYKGKNFTYKFLGTCNR